MRARRSGFWFFLLLAMAGACAVVLPIWYNLRQQLRPEQLDAARARWQRSGPRDYDLVYEEKQDSAPRPSEYRVIVRDRKVWIVLANRDMWMAKELAMPLAAAIGPMIVAVAADIVPQRELSGYTVDGQFRIIEQNLTKNEESGGSNFATASFDPSDGHPIRYIYRVKRSPERLEWTVKLVRP